MKRMTTAMDATGMLILLCLALSTPVLAFVRDFQFVKDSKTWTEAQHYCRENFVDLATIESVDWARVSKMIKNSGSTYVWSGMYDDVKSWKWSLDDTLLYEGGTVTLGSWFDFQTDNFNSAEHCGFMVGGTLDDGNCETAKTFLCYDESSNSYIPVSDPMTWQSARSYCTQNHTDLAAIRNQQEWIDIVSATNLMGEGWVGLSRETWKWSDQSNSSFRMWLPSQPNSGTQNCVAAYANGLNDLPCQWKMPFICSTPPRRVLKVVLNTDASADLNDPEMQEAFLKAMKSRLREQQLWQEVRLSWRMIPKVFNETHL